MVKALFLVICCLTSYCCFGQQYVGHYSLPAQRKAITLTDAATGNRFVLDSTRIMITALDPQGKELWKTDAWKDNQLKAYRESRPVISYFAFGKNGLNRKNEVIWITYNNTQFGFLDKKTGAFTWLGQD